MLIRLIIFKLLQTHNIHKSLKANVKTADISMKSKKYEQLAFKTLNLLKIL